MRKKFSSILSVMISAAIGFTGISASAAANADMKATLEVWDEYDESIDSPAVTTAVITKPIEATTTAPKITTVPIITMATTATMPLSGYCFYTEDKKIIADDVSVVAGDTVSVPFEFEDFVGEPVILDVSGSADLEILGVYLEGGTEVKKSGSGAYEVTESKGYVKIKASETVTDSNCVLWFNGEARKSVSGTNIIYVYKYSKKINVNASEKAVTTPVTTKPIEATTTVPQITIVPILTLPITTVMDGEPASAMWIVNEPDKLTYNIGEELDLTGLTVSVKAYGGYNDSGYSKEIYSNVNPLDYPDVFTIDTSEFDNTKAGTYKIGVRDNEGYGFAPHYDYFTVTVEDEGAAVTTSVTTEQTETTTTTTTTTTPPTTTTTETTQPIGDVNKDNEVNVRDCAEIASALAKGEKSKLPKTADFNGDGKADVRDAAAIAKMLADKKKN